MLGHMHHPRVSPCNTWGQQHQECITTHAMFLQSLHAWSSLQR